MGCFGSRHANEPESNTIQIRLIAVNYQKLSQPFPQEFDREVMKPLTTSFASPQIEPLPASHFAELTNLNFPIFTKNPEYLKSGILSVFLSRKFPMRQSLSLIECIYLNYQPRPFHNFFHGFAVFQMLFVVSERNQRFSNHLSPNEERLLLLSGLGHDLNHPGLNNGFMVNTKHEVALRFNNTAVLENYHAATLTEFLREDRMDLGLTENDREIIVKTILGTDMTQHKSVMEKFAESMKAFDANSLEHKLSLMRMIIHSADVGNPALNFDLATIWSLKIIQEFNAQVWMEEKFEVQVSEFMRIGDDIGKIKKSQISFIDFFILPLWKSVSEFVPHTSELVENIEKNRKYWEEITSL